MIKIYIDAKNQTIGTVDPDPANTDRIDISVKDSIPFPVFLSIMQAAQATKALGQMTIITFGK